RRQRRKLSVVDGWRYRATWKPTADIPTVPLTGTWLLAVPDSDAAGEWATVTAGALADHGATVVEFPVAVRADRATLAAGLTIGDDTPAGVVSLLAFDGGAAETAILVQALGDAGIDGPLWCLTCGAVSTGPSDGPPDPDQASVWGLGRVVALEHPTRWGGL